MPTTPQNCNAIAIVLQKQKSHLSGKNSPENTQSFVNLEKFHGGESWQTGGSGQFRIQDFQGVVPILNPDQDSGSRTKI